MAHKSKIALFTLVAILIAFMMWVGSVVAGELLMLENASASHKSDKEFQNFIIQTRYEWNSVMAEFYNSRKHVYILRESGMAPSKIDGEIERFQVLENRLNERHVILDTEDSTRNANNIIGLLHNATMELRFALNAKDEEMVKRHITNANTQVSMANRILPNLAKAYGYDLGEYHHIKDSIKEEL